MAGQINVTHPGAGETLTYRLEPGVQVKFNFDIAEALFAGVGDNLVITLADGGTVVLQDFLALARTEDLPVFELLNGQMVPGGLYLFAFESDQISQNADGQDLETAAGGDAAGSGAGTYADDPGALGDGLDALHGQQDAFAAPSATVTPDTAVPLLAEDGRIFHAETETVQIVLNPSFEASSYSGDRWTYLDDVDHWRNTGDAEPQILPQFLRMSLMNARSVSASNEDSSMKTWGDDMPQKPHDGARLMELDATSGTLDTLSQAIATKAGEALTVSFNFAPRVDEAISELGMDTNDFQVTLGDQLVAIITWDADYGDGAWLVTLGDGVTSADHGSASFHFSNWGYTEGSDALTTDWTTLTFSLTAHQDHAALTFSELAGHNDGYGTLLDSVTAYRDFDTHLVGGETDLGHAEYLAGTSGDDAIFGSAHSVVDGVDNTFSYAEVIDGGAGDDALYGGQNFLTIISGGSGNDFIVAGRPLYEGVEESHATGEAVGQNYILPGSGNDYVRLGEGADSIILNHEALVNGETLTVENFTPDSGDTLNPDHLFLADGLTVQSSNYSDGDLHLLIGDGSGTIEVTLVGMHPTDLDAFVHTGSDADTLNDQIQAIIDSGGHLA